MTENSFLSMFADPSSDMFGSLSSNDDNYLSTLQPSMISSSSYQPVESESIMTLGEPTPGSKSGQQPGASSGMQYSQLGLGGSPYGASLHPSFQSAAHRFPGAAGYYGAGSVPSGTMAYPSHAQNPSVQTHPPRFGHDPYRPSQFTAYPHHNPSSAGSQNTPSSWPMAPNPLTALNSSSQSYLGQQGAGMRHYHPHQGYSMPDGQSQFMGHSQQQFQQMGATQGFQPGRMIPGYGSPMGTPVQQTFQPGSQYGYPTQQNVAMPQSRLPGMPYAMQGAMQNRFGQPAPPSVGLQQMQSQHRPTGLSMLPPVSRMPGTPEISSSPSQHGPGKPSSAQEPKPHTVAHSAEPHPPAQSAPAKPAAPSPAPSHSSQHDVPGSASTGVRSPTPSQSLPQHPQGSPMPQPHQQQQNQMRSPESPGMRPPVTSMASSPLPSMFGHQMRMPQSGQFQSMQGNGMQNMGGMQGQGIMRPPPNQMMQGQQPVTPAVQRIPSQQQFSPGPQMMLNSNTSAPNFIMQSRPPQSGPYQNGTGMPQPSPQFVRPPGPGSAPMPNIEAEIQSIQFNIQSLVQSTPPAGRPPEVEKRIGELHARLDHLKRYQAATAAQQDQKNGPQRMPYMPSGPGRMPGPGMPQQGMMTAQGPGLQGMSMSPQMGMMRQPSMPRPMQPMQMGPEGTRPPMQPGMPHGLPPMQNGFPSNGHPGKDSLQPVPPQIPQSPPPLNSDTFSGELASSQDDDDDAAANKYATPKKKRNRSSGASSGRRRRSPGDSPAGSDSPSKSRNRSRKPKQLTKPLFQFGRKKKKKRGSDDEAEDLDATPPPSPSVIEQDFDGNYVEKRRSTRVTKRKKYIDEAELEMSEPEEQKAKAPSVEHQPAVDEENGSLEPVMREPDEPRKSFFVQPGDPDPIVVEKIMASRTGKREVPKEPTVEEEKKESTDEEKADEELKPEPEKKENEPVEIVEVEEFYVKFKNFSYLHCDWKTADELEVIDKRIKQKITRFKQKKEQASFVEEMDDEPFDPNYTEVERVLDEKCFSEGDVNGNAKQYFLIKWCGLPYDECTWELEEDCEPKKIAEFRQRQIAPPPYERKRVSRPSARDWHKMDKASLYKNGNTLRDYQLEGVNWLLFSYYHGQNCILADEMGLGKTVQSTVFLEHVRRFGIRGPFLVVVPLSTLGNWAREVETWTDMNAIVYHGSSTAREVMKEYEFYYRTDRGLRLAGILKFNIFITTYEILLSDLNELREIEWRAIVIDEAHRLKNKNCKLLEGLKLLDMEHRALLTGTPLQNNVEELFSLLNFLEPERFSNAEAFSSDFGDLKTDDQVQRLQHILKPMMLRRLKEDVEKSIAPKEETIIEVELTNMQKKWYRALLEKNFTFLQKGTSSANVPNLMNVMMELRKCCNHPYLIKGAEEQIISELAALAKVDAQDSELLTKSLVQASGKLVLIDKLFPKLKEGGHKVLVFSQMVRCLDILEDYLVQKRYLFERIDGRVRGQDRQAAIDRFSREDSDRFVFLLCTRAGGLGINLTAADTVIIFDSDWNPQNDLQAQARCHRIGQDKPVKVYRLITRNSYEREMFDKASLKLGLDKAVLQSGQMTGGAGGARDAYAASQQQLSKSDIEDLLKRGAYGALMEDDTAADQFCTEDIDQILQRRTQTVQLEAGEKGSTFSKASFAATGTRDDIDINDPDFWQKWAKKAEVSTDKDVFENELIIHEPRRRLQVRRYGEEQEEEVPEDASDEDYDSDDEGGRGRRGKKGKKGGKGKDKEDVVRPGSWLRMECLRLERGLLAWGWGRWKEILVDAKFKRDFTEKDVEIFSRTLVHYCCRQYSGSDDKAKPYIWELVLASYKADWATRKALLQQMLDEGAGQDSEEATPSKSKRNQRRSAKKATTPEAEPVLESDEIPNWEADERFDPEKMLDVVFLKHMKKQSINRLVLRLKLLQNLKEEAIQDLGPLIMADTVYTDIPLEIPSAEAALEKPTEWWDDDADKCLMIGVYKHGFENYAAVRNDPKLCFLTKCGPIAPPEAPAEKPKDPEDPDAEEARETESTDAEPEAEGGKRRKRESRAQKEKEKDKEKDGESVDGSAAAAPVKKGRGRRPAAAKRQTVGINGETIFPSDADCNTRVRRLISAFEKRRIRAEQMEIRKQQRVERQMMMEKEKEARKLEAQQKKWSKREEQDFHRVVSIFGVEYGADKDSFEWDKFREISRLDKKLDSTLTEYFRAFYGMLKRVCGKKLTRDEEALAEQVEPLSEDKASRCLQRIELLYRIRVVALRHQKLEERLKLCQPSHDLPNWWILGQHDRELLEGAAKHGLADTACNIAVDCDYTFADCIKSALNAGENKKHSSKMESILKREVLKADKHDEEKDMEVGDGDANDEKLIEKAKSPKEKTTRSPKAKTVKEELDDASPKGDLSDSPPKDLDDLPAKPDTDEEPKRSPLAKVDSERDPRSPSESEVKPEKQSRKSKPVRDYSDRPSSSRQSHSRHSFEPTENPYELTVAQLLAKGMTAKGWPTDRVIQCRLDHICYCVEHNRWPSKRTQAAVLGAITDAESLSAPQPIASTSGLPQFSENFLDNPDFAMLAAAGHIPGLNGLEPRRGRRGRRPKAEIEAERLAQYHAAQQALLQQQQAFMTAAASASAGSGTKRGRSAHEGSSRREHQESTANRPPPAHGRTSNNSMASDMEGGALDLTGKAKPAESSLGSGRKEPQPGEKGSKLSQKVDTLLKKRKQEVEHDFNDPDCRIPVINLRDGSILQGDKAPKRKDLNDWLAAHPYYMVDTQAFPGAMSGFAFPPEMFANGLSAASSSRRSGQDSSASSGTEASGMHLTGEENVTVINRKTGKKLQGRKAPLLKSLAEWLEANRDYDIDPDWAELLRDQGAQAAQSSSSKPPSGTSKRIRKTSSGTEEQTNLFGFPGFPMGAGGLMSGFGPRMPFGFPGLPGFPMMGMLPGMSGDSETPTKSETGSSSKKSEGREKKEPGSSSKKARAAEKEKEQQQQQAMESIINSQLPFIFPQAGLFGGLHPMFGQGFPGFPFPMGPNPLMNGFDPKDLPGAIQEKPAKEEKVREKSRKMASSPAGSTSSRTVEKSDPPSTPSSSAGRPRGRPPRDREKEAAEKEARKERERALAEEEEKIDESEEAAVSE